MRKSKQAKMQGEGFDPPESVPAIETAAGHYVECRDERMEMTKKEVASRSMLIAIMREHKRTSYLYDGYVISLSQEDKVKVKKSQEAEEGEGGEAEEADE